MLKISIFSQMISWKFDHCHNYKPLAVVNFRDIFLFSPFCETFVFSVFRYTLLWWYIWTSSQHIGAILTVFCFSFNCDTFFIMLFYLAYFICISFISCIFYYIIMIEFIFILWNLVFIIFIYAKAVVLLSY